MSKARFIELNSVEALEAVIESSKTNPAVLFKHSTSCPISHGVYRYVSEVDSEIYLVVVQRARDVSNAIAELTGIKHESPQAIVISNGGISYHASHYDVEAAEISRCL